MVQCLCILPTDQVAWDCRSPITPRGLYQNGKTWLIHLHAPLPTENFVFPNFISKAVICCMSQPQDQQTGEHRAVPCTILGSLLPYLHSWQSCWAPAAVRQSLTRLPGSQGTLSEMGGEAQFWHTAPRHGPVFCITKRLWSSRRLPGPAQSTGWSFHFLTAYTPNATLLSLHWEGSQTLP